MSQNPDYFAPTKWQPPVKPPRGPRSKAPLVIFGVLLLLGVTAAGIVFVVHIFAGEMRQQLHSLAIVTPPAKVVTGTPLKWRTLATFPKQVSRDNPRPDIVFDDFNRDGRRDIFMLDFKGRSKVFQPDGTSTTVSGKWDAVARFYSWDFDRDGVAELIPHSVVYAVVPVTTGRLAATRLCGG